MRMAIPYPCNGPRASGVLSTIRSSVPCRTSPRASAIAILLLSINRRLRLLLLIVNRSLAVLDEAGRKKFRASRKFFRQGRLSVNRATNPPHEGVLTRLVDRSTPGDLGWPGKSSNRCALRENSMHPPRQSAWLRAGFYLLSSAALLVLAPFSKAQG